MFCTYLLFQHFPRDKRDKGGKEDDQYREKQSDELHCGLTVRRCRYFVGVAPSLSGTSANSSLLC